MSVIDVAAAITGKDANKAAQDIGFRVHKTLHQTAASATEKLSELLELVDGTNAQELLQRALRGLLAKLESAMLSTFDANISGRVIKLGSMLLSQLHVRVNWCLTAA